MSTHKQLYEQTALGERYLSRNTQVSLSEIERDYLERCFSRKNGALLEGGCGSGRISFALEEAGHSEITAFDFSKPLVEDARRAAATRGSRVRFAEADACALPMFADESFDYIIYGAQLLSLIPMPARITALLEAKRVLRPDGVMVFSVLNRKVSLRRRVLLKLFALKSFLTRENFSPIDLPYLNLGDGKNWTALLGDKATVSWYSRAEAIGLAEAVGFSVIHATDTTRWNGGGRCFAAYVACKKAGKGGAPGLESDPGRRDDSADT